MKKWIRSLTLAVVAAVGTASVVSVSGPALQGQVKEKAEAKGSVVITKDKGGKFRFQVRDGDNKVVMMCVKGYVTEKDAIAAFEEALAIAKVAKPMVEKDKGGK